MFRSLVIVSQYLIIMLRLNGYRYFFLLFGPELEVALNKLNLEADLCLDLLLTFMGLSLPFQKGTFPIRH